MSSLTLSSHAPRINALEFSNLKLVFNHTNTLFVGDGVGGDREDEDTFFSRIQLSF